MDLIPTQQFLGWTRERAIVPDARYHPPECLSYASHRRHARFCAVPALAAEVPFFVSHLLAGLDPWRECRVWPRGGVWVPAGEQIGDRVRRVVLDAAGAPADFDGAVAYAAGELDKLCVTIFAHLAFGWMVLDDLFVVPDHGQQFLQTDHHDVVHVEFADADCVRPFIEHMAGEGYALPDEPPDPTFKRPDWM